MPSLVWRRLEQVVDAETAFATLFGAERYAFWLDSGCLGSGRHDSGWLAGLATADLPAAKTRFSFLGAAMGPGAEVLEARNGTGVRIHRRDGTQTCAGSAFDVLAERVAARRLPAVDPLPAEAACGYVGYFGYEAETGEQPRRHRSSLPDAVWMSASRFVVIDHLERCTWIVAMVDAGDDEDAAAAWAAGAQERLSAGVELPSLPAPDRAGGPVDPEPWLARSRVQYLRDIDVCLEQLRAGESYEICLTNLFERPFRGDPFTTYRRLRRANPAPYGAFLRLSDTYVLSSSPERFLTIDVDGVARAGPIKGTAPRDPDPVRDAELAEGLQESPKTRAENLMIVDLLRNDLGRVCAPGSIDVPAFLAVESYATVHQLVSTIRGRLRDGIDAPAAAKACFPPGSMTGAPKLSTMRILDGLETRPREIYSGALGMFGLTGTADLSVVIRTAVVHDGTVRVGAGGAIVLDSDPDEEYAEMLLKAATALRVLD